MYTLSQWRVTLDGIKNDFSVNQMLPCPLAFWVSSAVRLNYCHIGRLTSFSSYSTHTVSPCLLLYAYHRRSAGCFPFGDRSSWSDWIVTLPNGVPFRHMYSVFALATFIPLFSKASLQGSSSNYSMSFSLAHSTTSSANIICQGASFLVFPSVNPSWWQTRKGCKRILGGGQLLLQRVRLFLQLTSLQFHIDGTMSFTIFFI